MVLLRGAVDLIVTVILGLWFKDDPNVVCSKPTVRRGPASRKGSEKGWYRDYAMPGMSKNCVIGQNPTKIYGEGARE